MSNRVSNPVPHAGTRRPYPYCMKNARLLTLACALVAVFTLARVTDHAHAAQSSTLKGDAAHPAHTQGWVDTRLYFGLGRAEERSAPRGHSSAWRSRTPRPASLKPPGATSSTRKSHRASLPASPCSTSTASGRARPGDRPEAHPLQSPHHRLPHHARKRRQDRSHPRRLEEVTGDQSVMNVTQPAEVSF